MADSGQERAMGERRDWEVLEFVDYDYRHRVEREGTGCPLQRHGTPGREFRVCG